MSMRLDFRSRVRSIRLRDPGAARRQANYAICLWNQVHINFVIHMGRFHGAAIVPNTSADHTERLCQFHAVVMISCRSV
jgi:hypothetical protein